MGNKQQTKFAIGHLSDLKKKNSFGDLPACEHQMDQSFQMPPISFSRHRPVPQTELECHLHQNIHIHEYQMKKRNFQKCIHAIRVKNIL